MLVHGGKEYYECFSLTKEITLYSQLQSMSFVERNGILMNESDIFVKDGKIASKKEIEEAFSALPRIEFKDKQESAILIRNLCGAKSKRQPYKKEVVVEEESSEFEESEEEEEDDEEDEEEEEED
jgi:hypothetical protein